MPLLQKEVQDSNLVGKVRDIMENQGPHLSLILKDEIVVLNMVENSSEKETQMQLSLINGTYPKDHIC